MPQRVGELFRPGRPVDVFPPTQQNPPRPVAGGILDNPATNPAWLVHTLHKYQRSRANGPIGDARPRWQCTVRGCSVTADGRELWFTVGSHQDEVLAGFDVEQTPERVAVRAWLAFGPDGPTTFGEGKVRVLPDGRRVGRMRRKAAGREWSTIVRLDQPLGTRPVVDIASPDPNGVTTARRAWLAAHG